jgi:hypothetical protein
MRRILSLVIVSVLAACGPSWSPSNSPADPCPMIDEAAYNAAREAGAAHGTAEIKADGSVRLNAGPGVSHCATYSSVPKVCRRPNDYVIAYTQVDGSKFYVRVSANAEYRFDIHSAPNTCEIVRPFRVE